MISWTDFENAIVSRLERNIQRDNNPNQNEAIRAPLDQSLFIVAGPGSGKTTAIALRVLKLVFVDEIDPSNIVATTFTRKAANELRSRILGWGDQLKEAFMNNSSYDNIENQLHRLDLNRIITGTLDSIAEETLVSIRTPGTPPPVVIEDFVANALMIRYGLFCHGRHNNSDLRSYIGQLRGTVWNLNISEISSFLRDLKDRFYHDRIDIDQFRGGNSDNLGVQVMCDAIIDYVQELQGGLHLDFALLEQNFLDRLRDGTLDRFLQDVRFILVDEYQDTNLLQEQIYVAIADAALRNGGSITVVGDDDQSLFRFRGATVDLFREFPSRISNQLVTNPLTIYLSQNYRSTEAIVNFCNGFVTLDQEYQSARVQGKPAIVPMRQRQYENFPVLGMFRENTEQLAHDLANFIHRVIYDGGVSIWDHQGHQYNIRINPLHGGPADIALLFSSPLEFSGERERLPLLLRNRLSRLSPPIQIFNPRGQNLETIHDVQVLCGLILECIDPNSNVQSSMTLGDRAANMFNTWRAEARRYINGNPSPTNSVNLRQFVDAWRNRTPFGDRRWEREVALKDLVYNLVTWIPNMQDDIEGLVYLEAITRTINQAGLFGNYSGQLILDENNSRLEEFSIKEILWNVFMPIATSAIEVNEDLLETLPPNRINVMSIHQAKGLEFPLVIVDVGSDFRDLHSPAFKRFPRNGGKTCNVEDTMRPYSPLDSLERSALDRAFDDLVRLYFEAYSRAQDVLMLIGLNSVKDGYFTSRGQCRSIPNVATGWDRSRNWCWGRGLENLLHI